MADTTPPPAAEEPPPATPGAAVAGGPAGQVVYVTAAPAPPTRADSQVKDVLLAALPSVVTALLLQALEELGAVVKLVIAALLGLGMWWLLRARGRSRAQAPQPAAAAPDGPAPAAPESRTRRGLPSTGVLLLLVLAVLSILVLLVAALLFSRPTWWVVLLVALGLAALIAPVVLPGVVPSAPAHLALPLAAAVAGATLGLGIATSVTEARDASPEVPANVSGTEVTTFDGLAYPLRAVGDLWVVRSADPDRTLQVQTRLEPVEVGSGRSSALPVAVAASLGSTVVLFAGSPPEVSLGGRPATGGGPWREGDLELSRSGDGWTVSAPSDQQISIASEAGFLSWRIQASSDPRAGYEGLLGDGDGDSADDLRTSDGTVIAPDFGRGTDTQERIDGEFADSWRVSDGDQILD